MKKKLLILPALAIGVLVFVLMSRGKSDPQVRRIQELATTVRVLAVPRTDVQPRAIGYGEARPGRVWQAVPQVGGRIVELSSKVREGRFVSKDEILVRIDKTDYDLEVSIAEARLRALRAQLEETKTRETTIRRSLEIEKRSLALAKVDVERIRSLVTKRSLPEADLDREERGALTQGLRVQEIENSLTLLEPQRAVLDAQITQEETHLEKARVAVKRTTILAPFDCRIGPVSVEQDQVVQPGQILFSADGTDSTEVTAWLPVRGLRQVLTAGTADPAEVDLVEGIAVFRERLGLEAVVRLSTGADAVRWDAEVVRVRGIDSKTRAIGMDVAVKDPYGSVVPGIKPPLTRGMYVEVEIRARARPDMVVVPRSALHDDVVFLVDAEQRLVRRPVVLAFVQGTFAVVREGLEGGETLVLSDVVPAVNGMLVAPVEDAEALATLRADASGKASPR